MKMIVIDLDGTLLDNNNNIKENTIKYLNDLINKNYIIVLASARAHRNIIEYASNFPENMPLISENGAQINSLDNSIKYNLSNIKKEEFLRLFIDNKNIIKNGFFSVLNNIYIYNRIKKLEPFYNINSNTNIIEASYETINIPSEITCITLVINSQDKENFEQYLNNNLKNIINYKLLGFDSKNAIYELSGKLVNKAFAVKLLIEKYNIDYNNLVVFGDGDNDIEMLKLTNNSIAMLNASNNLKKVAKYITKYDNDHEGVYHFLKEYIKNTTT